MLKPTTALILSTLIILPSLANANTNKDDAPPAPENTVAPVLAVQVGGGVTAARSFTAQTELTYGDLASGTTTTQVVAGSTPQLVATIESPPTGTAAFAFTVRDAATGGVTLAYMGWLTVLADGNLSMRKESTPLDASYWSLHATDPVLVISQGRAAAWIVADAWVDTSKTGGSRLVLRWGVDQDGTGEPRLQESPITQERTLIQEFFPVLPVKTAFALEVVDGEKVLGSVRGDFFLGGLPTFQSSITQTIAPLSEARIAAFRLPRNVAIIVNASEYVTTTNSTQTPSSADKLLVSAGETNVTKPELVPACPDGLVFQMGTGCTTPFAPETTPLESASVDEPTAAQPWDWRLWLVRGAWVGIVAVVALAGASYAIGRLRR